MALNIKIKPLVLFDLEDKIRLHEQETDETGDLLYQAFLSSLTDLQNGVQKEMPAYKTVKKYVSKDSLCSLFYTITGNTVLVIGIM